MKRRLRRLKARMEEDKRRLGSGTPRAKVEAAGDLALIEQRLAETKQKLSRVESEDASGWEDFKSELEEDFDHIEMAVERWVARQ